MTEETKNRVITVSFWALIVSGALFWFLRERGKQSSEASSAASAHIQREKAIRSLAAEHNATQDWDKSLATKTNFFTIDIQDALLDKAAPLQFIGNLVDIQRIHATPVAIFNVSASGFSLSLRLHCTDDQRKILTEKLTDYAIIANIVKVVRQGDLSIVDASRDEDGAFDDVTFEPNWDAETYWAEGVCLDVRKL